MPRIRYPPLGNTRPPTTPTERSSLTCSAEPSFTRRHRLEIRSASTVRIPREDEAALAASLPSAYHYSGLAHALCLRALTPGARNQKGKHYAHAYVIPRRGDRHRGGLHPRCFCPSGGIHPRSAGGLGARRRSCGLGSVRAGRLGTRPRSHGLGSVRAGHLGSVAPAIRSPARSVCFGPTGIRGFTRFRSGWRTGTRRADCTRAGTKEASTALCGRRLSLQTGRPAHSVGAADRGRGQVAGVAVEDCDPPAPGSRPRRPDTRLSPSTRQAAAERGHGETPVGQGDSGRSRCSTGGSVVFATTRSGSGGVAPGLARPRRWSDGSAPWGQARSGPRRAMPWATGWTGRTDP